jgi:hypothetical protein
METPKLINFIELFWITGCMRGHNIRRWRAERFLRLVVENGETDFGVRFISYLVKGPISALPVQPVG